MLTILLMVLLGLLGAYGQRAGNSWYKHFHWAGI